MEIGDVVYLKSGSSAMTVIKLNDEDKSVDLQWANGPNFMTTRTPIAALCLEDPSPAIRKSQAAKEAEINPQPEPKPGVP